jgi:hypothetical protein
MQDHPEIIESLKALRRLSKQLGPENSWQCHMEAAAHHNQSC